MSKVSVVLPAYKRRFLKEAIASILTQTYRDFALVVVDDCSPENLKEVVDEFHDERLTYHRNEQNLGGKDLVAAWNHAMEYATGEWCVLASDDDVYLPRFLEEMVRLQKLYPACDLFHCWIDVVDARGNVTYHGAHRQVVETVAEMYSSRCVKRVPQTFQEYMFRRSALQEVGGIERFPLAWFSDDATWLKLSINNVVCAQEVLFLWRNSDENISGRTDHSVERITAAAMYKKWLRRFMLEFKVDGDFALAARASDKSHARFVRGRSLSVFLLLMCRLAVVDPTFVGKELLFRMMTGLRCAWAFVRRSALGGTKGRV